MENRDLTIDIGKGIAIILMCVGHSYVCTFLDTFIYLFHMAFFFLMSGYFFRKKNLAAPRTFLWKRIKGLYFPFVKWGFIFVALHNVFTTLGINTREAGFYSIKDMAYKAFSTNTRFIPTEECMGAILVLLVSVLCVLAIICCVLCKQKSKIQDFYNGSFLCRSICLRFCLALFEHR